MRSKFFGGHKLCLTAGASDCSMVLLCSLAGVYFHYALPVRLLLEDNGLIGIYLSELGADQNVCFKLSIFAASAAPSSSSKSKIAKCKLIYRALAIMLSMMDGAERIIFILHYFLG